MEEVKTGADCNSIHPTLKQLPMYTKRYDAYAFAQNDGWVIENEDGTHIAVLITETLADAVLEILNDGDPEDG